MKFRGLRWLGMVVAIAILWFGSTVWTLPAQALTDIELTDLSYEECPAELAAGMMVAGSSGSATCYIVTGTALNKTDKYVYDADIFGRIFDANGNNVMRNRTRLGLILEVPPGESEFDLRISVPSNMSAPLSLEQFKARGFPSPVRRKQSIGLEEELPF